VVIVDEQYDATWLWWAFRRYGKSNVQVLDGGLKAWKNQQLPLNSGPFRPAQKVKPGMFTAAVGADFPVADLAMVLASQHDSSMRLWDTRELHEWDGSIRVRGAMRAGRIAWANHLHWNPLCHDCRSLTTFRRDLYIDHVLFERSISSSKTHIFYCQSGVRTTTLTFALYRRGWDATRLFNFEGSWREWSALPQPSILSSH
jgi:thiosulfate/3-mercaptopyruvate sulfurtransferase